MFIRKIFSSKNKLLWVLIDLLIVIIGVYCAFLIQQYAGDKRDRETQDRVLTALKYEMETFRFTISGIARSMSQKHKTLEAIQKNDSYSNFSNFRFIEPQYDYQAIEHALSLQNPAIVDFELNEALQSLWVQIKRIEHVERLLTETSARYRSIPQGLDRKSSDFQMLWAENKDNFGRFLLFIKDRASVAQQVSLAASASLVVINDRLGQEKMLELEYEIIGKNIRRVASSEEEAVRLGQIFYPHISKEKIQEIYRQAEE